MTTRLLTSAALLAALLTGPSLARADWSVIDFSSPRGKAARGIATTADADASARLVIGCEQGDGGWRGVALLRRVAHASDATQIGVTVSFFGRAPVSERWALSRASDREEVASPPSGESLRRNLLREEATRGNPSVTIELRANDGDPATLRFALDELGARSTELASLCGGWGGASQSKRRERGW